MNQFHALFDTAFALMERIEVTAAVRDRNLFGPMTHRRDLQTELESHLHGLVSLASDYESELKKHNASLEHSYAALGPCDFGDRDPYALGSIEKLATELMSWVRQMIQMLGQRGLTSMRSKQAGFLLKLTKRCPFSEELAAKIDQRLWLEKSQLMRDYQAGDGENAEQKDVVSNKLEYLMSQYHDPYALERDHWIYAEAKSGKDNRAIQKKLQEKCRRNHWKLLENESSVREALKRFCERAGIAIPERSKGGRPCLTAQKNRAKVEHFS